MKKEEIEKEFDELTARAKELSEEMKFWRDSDACVDLVFQEGLFIPIDIVFSVFEEKLTFLKEVFAASGTNGLFRIHLFEFNGVLDFLANVLYETSRDKARKIVCDTRQFYRKLILLYK